MSPLDDAEWREHELLRTVARFGALVRDVETGNWVMPTGLEIVPRWVILAAQVRPVVECGYLEVDEDSEPNLLRLTPAGRARLGDLRAKR